MAAISKPAILQNVNSLAVIEEKADEAGTGMEGVKAALKREKQSPIPQMEHRPLYRPPHSSQVYNKAPEMPRSVDALLKKANLLNNNPKLE